MTPSLSSLPFNPSLEFDRKQAKALLDAARSGDGAALARFSSHHPRFIGVAKIDATALALHDAQLVIAREYGFASWPRWKQFVETRRLDRAARAAALVAAALAGDMRKATTLVGAEPDLAVHDLYTACVCGEAEHVQQLLDRDPSLAKQKGGPEDREPILYACFSRFLRADATRGAGIVKIVRLLLGRGADPNAHFYTKSGNETWVQTCLYGAAGMANNAELVAMLLAAGADVNELQPDRAVDPAALQFGTEALYHASEFGDATCVRLLLEARPYPSIVSYCLARMLDFENPAGVDLYLTHGADPNFRIPWLHNRTHLGRAVTEGRNAGIVVMLLEHGGDPNAKDDRDLTPYQYAVRRGNDEIARLLADRGADTSLVTDVDRAMGRACRSGNSVAAAIQIDPDLLCLAAKMDDVEAIAHLLDAGADINALGGQDATPPLHWAVWRSRYDAAKMLLERGASITLVNRYGGTALGTCIHGSVHCDNPDGGNSHRLPSERPPGRYPEIVQMLIDAGSTLPKITGGSEFVQEVLRRNGVPDAD